MDKAKQIATNTLVGQIDEFELAMRICEGCLGLARPAGKSAEECLKHMPEDNRDSFRRAARMAMAYWIECIQTAQKTN